MNLAPLTRVIYKRREAGTVKRCNEHFAFVVYDGEWQPKATRFEDLELEEKAE